MAIAMLPGVRAGLRQGLLGLVVALACGLSSAATPAPTDPWEPMNRAIYGFNDALDRVVVKPFMQVYVQVLPHWARRGVNHFFGNLTDVWSVPNNALALRPKATADSIKRVVVNSTIGVFGLIDVASEWDIDKHPADAGVTLGRWGIGAGPYVVLPFLGPRTLREVAMLPVDRWGNVANHVDSVIARDALMLMSFIDLRETYLQAGDVIKAAALDPYTFTRDSYL
ncbi:MAG: VacJ family lipoprotein, partial [Betaproteobacteria bacterium]|nr:VacJ family lipoprotein [Betaproteobacteria bacterium]